MLHVKLPRASNEAPKIYATVIYKTFHQCKLVFFAQVIQAAVSKPAFGEVECCKCNFWSYTPNLILTG